MKKQQTYVILITHTGSCPALLSESPDIHYIDSGDDPIWQCPRHIVFQRPCLIEKARRQVELLKNVRAITKINLLLGTGGGKDCWERDNNGRWAKQL